MQENQLIVKCARSEFTGTIKLRANEFQMQKITALRLILTVPDAEPEVYDVTSSAVLVEPLTGIREDMADYTFTIGSKEAICVRHPKIIERMRRQRIHYMLTFCPFDKVRICEFKMNRVEWDKNGSPWIQHERLRHFSCSQLLAEIERRSEDCRMHRRLDEDRSAPITEQEWSEYDQRHEE